MKQVYLIFFGFLTFIIFPSCDFCLKKDVARPKINDEELKWVNLNNSRPQFNLSYVEDGITKNEVLQGKYILDVSNEERDIENSCSKVLYQIFYNQVSLNSREFNGATFILKNASEVGFEGEIFHTYSKFDKNTILDTALINGKIYSDVFKDTVDTNEKYYYAKSYGFIYMERYDYQINGIKKLEIIH